MEFLRKHQIDIMLILIGICAVLALLTFFTRILSKKRKSSLMFMELGVMTLLIADRFAYIFRGNVSTLGYFMVRISNFLLFFLPIFVTFGLNLYLIDLYLNEVKLKKKPVRLRIAGYFCITGIFALIFSQFTGFYYTFDDANRYQRSFGFMYSYIFPFGAMFLQFSVIIQYFKKISRSIAISILLFITLPFVFSIVQVFTYGISLMNMTMVGAAIMFYVFVILDMNRQFELATQREIELLKEDQQKMNIIFTQTAEALSSAIDAKDKYTHGHSKRVAKYSKQIAQLAGKSESECQEIYFAALLHDVGKIGVADAIINKTDVLTNDEFTEIKKHPVIGKDILSHINKSPYIGVGAKYHHERFDGNGYPEGLSGKNIPEIARIIAIADSYDAMTSNRSYRKALPQEKVRREILKGIGRQFDPEFATIMLNMIDSDKDYTMKE